MNTINYLLIIIIQISTEITTEYKNNIELKPTFKIIIFTKRNYFYILFILFFFEVNKYSVS